MFDFFFKKRSAAKSTQLAQLQSQQKELTEQVQAATKFADKQTAKQAELDQAANFAGQEDAAVAFILQSAYADARYQAVQHVQTAAGLEQISQAMRNTDRRVSKYAQEKLTSLQINQKMNDAAENCLRQGRELLTASSLMVNQVADWDKSRLALGEHGVALVTVKEELEQRLQAQLDLQRQSLDISRRLNTLLSTETSLEAMQAHFAACELQWQQLQSDRLWDSLPKHYLAQVNHDFLQTQRQLQQVQDTVSLLNKRAEALSAWKNSLPASLAGLRKEWQQWSLTSMSLTAEQQQLGDTQEQELADLTDQFTATASPQSEQAPQEIQRQHLKKEPTRLSIADIALTITALEQALEQGSLQTALDLDKSLRSVAKELRGDHVARLQTLRAELNRLLDWAKWGGNVSREELIKVAEGVLSLELVPEELAKQVGGLRARWKELDRTSGSAPKSIWERFDSACNRAYEVADAYFKQQAQLRLANLQSAQEQLTGLNDYLARTDQPITDWKEYQAWLAKIKLDWRQLGPIDRKFKTNLDSEFGEKINRLQQPLMEAQASAVSVRQQIIQSVSQINPSDREAPEKVQQAQQRWQQQASLLPLERKEEQKLWKQFRAACDAIFEQRKASSEEQKQRRQQANTDQQRCCEQLENYLSQHTQATSAEINQVIRDARQEWRELANHVRSKTPLDGRFDSAIKLLEHQLHALEQQTKQLQLQALKEKIKLCQTVEQEKSADETYLEQQSQVWKKDWDQLIKVPTELNKVLNQRWMSALSRLTSKATEAQSAAQNQLDQFEECLLRMEILNGLPSPVETMAQRLQLQVKDLQSAMKNRGNVDPLQENLRILCASPVVLSTQQQQRLERILDHVVTHREK